MPSVDLNALAQAPRPVDSASAPPTYDTNSGRANSHPGLSIRGRERPQSHNDIFPHRFSPFQYSQSYWDLLSSSQSVSQRPSIENIRDRHSPFPAEPSHSEPVPAPTASNEAAGPADRPKRKTHRGKRGGDKSKQADRRELRREQTHHPAPSSSPSFTDYHVIARPRPVATSATPANPLLSDPSTSNPSTPDPSTPDTGVPSPKAVGPILFRMAASDDPASVWIARDIVQRHYPSLRPFFGLPA